MKIDVVVRNEGTISMVWPKSEAASAWVKEHVPGEAMWFGWWLIVEHRYVEPLLEGMKSDGLHIAGIRGTGDSGGDTKRGDQP